MRSGGFGATLAACGFGFALLLGCVPPHEDDGFRAKVAAGCSTAAACEELYRQAQERWASCINDRRQTCDDLMRDKVRASDLKRDEEKREEAARAQAHRAAYDKQVADVRAEHQRRADENERRAKASMLEGQVRSIIRVGSGELRSLPDIETPSALSVRIDEARARLEELRAIDSDAAAKLDPEVASWTSSMRDGIAAEERCRASTQCMGDRAAVPVCETIARRQNAAKEIARERANPSGYVNATYLHDLGQQIQDADEQLPQLKKQYAIVAKRPFSETACAKKP